MIAAGTVAETRLAQLAGLDVGPGIVVGPDLATPVDLRVFAIGDCAQPPEGGTGLIAQGWDPGPAASRTSALNWPHATCADRQI